MSWFDRPLPPLPPPWTVVGFALGIFAVGLVVGALLLGCEEGDGERVLAAGIRAVLEEPPAKRKSVCVQGQADDAGVLLTVHCGSSR